MDEITEKIRAALMDIEYGKVQLECTVHNGQVTTANIVGDSKFKKYKGVDNVDVGTDIITLIKNAQNNKRNGTLSFTVVMNEGVANRLIESDVTQVRNQ
jgi:hypothetical protein